MGCSVGVQLCPNNGGGSPIEAINRYKQGTLVVSLDNERDGDAFYLGPGEEDENQELQEIAARKGIDPEKYSAMVAAGKVMTLLLPKDSEISVNSSVYDTAIVIPQICRSGGNPKSFVHLSIRAFSFLFLNFALQVFVIYMIYNSEKMMQMYAGQVKLCDFGANVETCPEGANCIGPSGTNFDNPGRIYSFKAWQTRTYFRDMLLATFPEREDDINRHIDPGEYGVENYWVRFVCVFVFMMSVGSDIFSSYGLSKILWHLPRSESNWMEFDMPSWADEKVVKEFNDCGEVDFVKFKMAGMSRTWKIINCVLIVIPKLMIFRMAASAGVFFLMETAGIQDCIVNVTALSFILNLDEMIFSLFSHQATRHIMNNIEPFSEIPENDAAEGHSIQECVAELEADKKRSFFGWSFMPVRLLIVVFLSMVFIAEYYLENCQRNAHGGWVSKEQRAPVVPTFNPIALVLPWVEGVQEGEVFWRWREPST